MNNKIYGVIYNSSDMKELQDKCGLGETAVGITTNGKFFKYESSGVQPIFEGVVKTLLGINDEQLLKLKETKGLISPEELYGAKEVVPADHVEQKEFPEQSETATNEVDEEVLNDPPSETVTVETPVTENVDDDVHEPEVSKVEITEDEYNELLKAEEDNERLNEALEKARNLNTTLHDELSEIKKAASVIANLIK